MTSAEGKGQISIVPGKKLRYVLSIHVFWMLVLLALGIWWTLLAHKQAIKIAALETSLGLPQEIVHLHVEKTKRMMHWEGGTFILLLLVSTGLLFWLYWRDWFRSSSLHAFFASVTHELRTPLSSIRLQAESLADHTSRHAEKDPQCARLVSRLIEDTMRLEAQVERTLELARLEGGGPLYLQSIEVAPWLNSSLGYWKEAFGERVEITSSLEDLFIEADPTALQVILKNILENSMNHSGASAGPVRISIRSENENGHIRIIFSDNGKPFEGDPRRLGKLFQKGARSHGAGVGLYLVTSLMKKMGGRADFSATPALTISLQFKGGAHHA